MPNTCPGGDVASRWCTRSPLRYPTHIPHQHASLICATHITHPDTPFLTCFTHIPSAHNRSAQLSSSDELGVVRRRSKLGTPRTQATLDLKIVMTSVTMKANDHELGFDEVLPS